MHRSVPLIAAVLLAMFGLTGCKVVMDDDAPANSALTAGAIGDEDRIAALLDKTFETDLVPHIRGNAVELGALQRELVADFDAAGTKYAHRGAGQGAPWNFPVKATGTIVESKLDTRARTISVDTDGDDAADLTVQLGPVIKGTSLRDAAPFYNFNDYRDQIEFAKLSRGINDRITAMIAVPEGDLLGRSVTVEGAVSMSAAGDAILLTPVFVEFGP